MDVEVEGDREVGLSITSLVRFKIDNDNEIVIEIEITGNKVVSNNISSYPVITKPSRTRSKSNDICTARTCLSSNIRRGIGHSSQPCKQQQANSKHAHYLDHFIHHRHSFLPTKFLSLIQGPPFFPSLDGTRGGTVIVCFRFPFEVGSPPGNVAVSCPLLNRRCRSSSTDLRFQLTCNQ